MLWNCGHWLNKQLTPKFIQEKTGKYLLVVHHRSTADVDGYLMQGIWVFANSTARDAAVTSPQEGNFAFSLRKKADYTALVTIGVDHQGNYYVLDIDRFKTDRIVDYYDHIVKAWEKWGFRKIRAEVTVAQQTIVKELKESYLKPNGIPLSIDEFRPTRSLGDKYERVAAVLEPKYDNMQIWHYKGGNCQSLEEELVMAHPPHDDIKDALANAISIAIIPKNKTGTLDLCS